MSVYDRGSDLPDMNSRYGLDVVSRFATVRGWRTVPDGKVIWAVVGPPDR